MYSTACHFIMQAFFSCVIIKDMVAFDLQKKCFMILIELLENFQFFEFHWVKWHKQPQNFCVQLWQGFRSPVIFAGPFLPLDLFYFCQPLDPATMITIMLHCYECLNLCLQVVITRRQTPAYSFGIKHSEYIAPYIGISVWTWSVIIIITINNILPWN